MSLHLFHSSIDSCRPQQTNKTNGFGYFVNKDNAYSVHACTLCKIDILQLVISNKSKLLVEVKVDIE